MVLPVTGNPATSTTTTTTATPEQLASSVAVVPSASPIAAPIADSAMPATQNDAPPSAALPTPPRWQKFTGFAVTLAVITGTAVYAIDAQPASAAVLLGSYLASATAVFYALCGYNVSEQKTMTERVKAALGSKE